MEGLLDKNRKTSYPKILKRLVAKPWAKQSVTLATEPLVKKLTPKEIKEVEDAHKVSWKKWFGAGWTAKGNLADSLSHWHWLSWQHGENMYPKEGEYGYERPADAKELEVECLGGLVQDLDDADGDPEYDAALDGVDGAPLTTKDVAFVKAARDAVGETVDDDDAAALEAAATASDDNARSVAADADGTESGAMDIDDAAGAGGLTPEVAATMKCFDLKNAGDDAWALVADDRGGKPCRTCAGAIRNQYNSCGFCEHAAPAAGKRGTRDRKERGATEKQIQDEQVKACNLVMDEKTGLRPDGNTCWRCWCAVYHEAGHHGQHALVGRDAEPLRQCLRTDYGKPYSKALNVAYMKLDYLEKSRAAGNR